MKLFLILFLIPLSVYGEDNDYLKARKKFYSKTIGDGFEKGVEFSFRKKILKVKFSEIPTPVLEISNNSAQCAGGIKINKVQPQRGRFQWVYYKGLIHTEVEGDTGGCIGLVRWPVNGDILKIIDYSYIADF